MLHGFVRESCNICNIWAFCLALVGFNCCHRPACGIIPYPRQLPNRTSAARSLGFELATGNSKLAKPSGPGPTETATACDDPYRCTQHATEVPFRLPARPSRRPVP